MNVPVGRAASSAKSARNDAGVTQLEMTFDDYYGSRESISHQENGRYQVQPELGRYFAEKHNNPWPALEAAAEYTSWGPVKLDGDAADLHRAAVLLKTLEELKEAVTSVENTASKIVKNPQYVESFEKEVIEKSIQEVIDVITAANHYVAILCKEYCISWVKMWTQHKVKLIQRRFIKK